MKQYKVGDLVIETKYFNKNTKWNLGHKRIIGIVVDELNYNYTNELIMMYMVSMDIGGHKYQNWSLINIEKLQIANR